jgi:lysosomal Pro-X carboxypeptidase
MFISEPFDYDAFTKDCQTKYKLTPRYKWVWDYLGGNDIQRDFQSISNIIFSNGQLDPWTAGGLRDTIKGNDKIDIIYIQQAAHHLDLREPNDEHDPVYVKVARD